MLCFFKQAICCFLLFVFLSSPSTSVTASDDEIDNELSSSFAKKNAISQQQKEKPKKKKKKKKLPQPKHYFLERYHNGNLLAQYTKSIKIDENITFSLDDALDIAMNSAVAALLPTARNHLVARGFCYHSDEPKTTEIKTSLGFEGIPVTPDVTIDWISNDAGDPPVNPGHYSRISPGGNHTPLYGGHSESYFISDIKALWIQNYTSVLKFLVPSPVFHGDQDVYMTGIELFGSRDMCSAYIAGHNNRYNCVQQLVNFRHEHEEGQQSISQAVRDLLKDRFKGGANSRGFVLIYHTPSPYGNADYKAVDGERSFSLSWGNNRLNSPAGDRPVANDILQQYAEVEEAPNRLYCHIHGLTDRQLTYNAAGYFQY